MNVQLFIMLRYSIILLKKIKAYAFQIIYTESKQMKYLIESQMNIVYLHCNCAQKTPLFLDIVSESELIVKKLPWPVQNTAKFYNKRF